MVLAEGRLLVVGRRRPPGRGAWLHADPSCVSAAIKTRAFGRAFRAAVEPPDAAALAGELALSITTRQPQRRG
jgi:predicted RNA-binding protein YlxR (DUF448 family)